MDQNVTRLPFMIQHKAVVALFLLLIGMNVLSIVAYQRYENSYLVVKFKKLVSELWSDRLSTIPAEPSPTTISSRLTRKADFSSSSTTTSTSTSHSTTSSTSTTVTSTSTTTLSTSITSSTAKSSSNTTPTVAWTTSTKNSSVTKKEETLSADKRQALLIDQFKSNHKQIVTNFSPKRFCYVGRNGFTMALVTNSALIVNWTDINKYIQEPFHSSFVTNKTLQNELSYLYRSNETRYFPYSTRNSFSARKQLDSYWKYSPDNKSNRLVFNIIGPVFYDLACETSFYPVFRDYGLVSENTLQRATVVMNSTPIVTNNETLNTVYRVGFELAHNIIRLFWKPTSIVTDQVTTLYDQHFKNNFVIGMQFRYWYLNWNDTFLFFECASKVEQAAAKGKTVKWYISADDNNHVEAIKKLYPDKVVTASGRITHVDGDSSGFARALVDIEMLARADEIIITAGSTFGFMSAYIGLRYPLFVKGRSNQTECLRFSFGQPSTTPNNHDIVK